MLIKAGLDGGYYWLVGFAVATSLLTLLSMLKIWSYGFWSPAQGAHVQQPGVHPNTTGGIVAVVMLVVVALGMGLGAQVFADLSKSAAKLLVDPRPYIAAVLGEDRLPSNPAPEQITSHPANDRFAAVTPVVPLGDSSLIHDHHKVPR